MISTRGMRSIAVSGGGLAGLSLAIGLRGRGVPVVLHEAGRYPRHRVCGEFISGVSAETLDALGIADDLADAGRPCDAAWFRADRKLVEVRLPDPARAISRFRLDQRLKDRLTGLGGRVVEGARQSRTAGEGRVWAGGRIPRKSGWIGLKCHLSGFRLEAELEMHLGGNGYAGLTAVEDGRVNLCGLFRIDRSQRGSGSALLLSYLRAGGHRGLADRIDGAELDESSFLGVGGFELGWQDPEPGLCTIGDACGMIPPFTGNGMSMAFESAELAVPVLAEWSAGRLAWPESVEAIARGQRRKFRRRVAAGLAIHRLLMTARGGGMVEWLSQVGMLPFRPMLSLVR